MVDISLNRQRLSAIAQERGLRLTKDEKRIEKVAGLMTENYLSCGEWVCPCKQNHQPPVSGKDITCPCPTLMEEIAAKGTCHCRLFVSIPKEVS
jgi:ferredoxin-thioredoxin reductase catalytic chain